MVKCSVYIAVSVDGYIARADGDVSWLHNPAYESGPGEDLGYDSFIESVDFLVMGRLSFEKVLTFGDWPYDGQQVVVLSSRDIELTPTLKDKVRVSNGSPEAVVAELAAAGGRHLYIDGGITIQRFLRANLIREITLTIIPIILGQGIPLFGNLENDRPLILQRSQSFSNGMVQNFYRVGYPS